VIEEIEHFTLCERIEIGKIRDHSGGRVDWTHESYLDYVVMPMPEGVVALAKRDSVIFRRERIHVKAVRGRKMIPTREMSYGLTHACSPK
jgi:hypothetical protein